MSSLVLNYPFSEFKKLKASELKRLKSCEVTSNGEYLFTFINAATDYIRDQVEAFALLSNTNSGEELEKILGV